MKDKDLIYHFIDWGIAIILTIIQIMSNDYIWILIIILIAAIISLFLILKKHKHLLDTYETLLKKNTPLYGLINYIYKKRSSPNVYKNEQIYINKLYLDLKLIGKIQPGKNNDLQFSWSFDGNNFSSKDVGSFYLRIGGDSAEEIKNINLSCVDCGNNNACIYRDNINKCGSQSNCSAFIAYYDIISNQGFSTLNLLKINFNKTIKPNGEVKLKVSYTWPQCYNCNQDYILIDPNNFARQVHEIIIGIKVDNTIIKTTSKVQLFSFDENSNNIDIVEKFKFDNNQNTFFSEITVEKNKIYFATIEN